MASIQKAALTEGRDQTRSRGIFFRRRRDQVTRNDQYFMFDHVEDIRMLEVVPRSVLSGCCDRCGNGPPLHMTRDERGHGMLLCRYCIEKATQVEKKDSC